MPREGPERIRQELAALQAAAYAPVATAEDLQGRLDQVGVSLATFDLAVLDVAGLKMAAPELIRAICALDLAVRGRVPEWRQLGLMSRPVQKALRATFLACRYAGDMLGELSIDHVRRRAGDKPLSAFTGGPLDTFVNPAFANGGTLGFQEGDVILLRGTRHNSAAIARIGDVDSQFSHVGMVHVDGQGRPWVVESLIEEGAHVQPLEQVLAHDLARAMLFRHRDSGLAARASRFIHDRVARSHTSLLRRIPYDFSMRLNGYRRLYCSKLVRQAYDVASRGRLKLPTYGTRLDMKNRDFFRRIGVRTQETFAPGDMELEPEFELVAEWRDYRMTADVRLQDILMDKLFEWMEVHGYVFRETFVIWLIEIFGKLSSHLSQEAREILGDAVPKVPRNMRRRTIGAIAMLHKTADPLLEELKRLDAATIAQTGRQLHPREVRAHLESLRARMGRGIGYLVAKA